jgi:Fe-S oxidoreductase
MGTGLVPPAQAHLGGVPAIVFWVMIPVIGIVLFCHIIWRRSIPLMLAEADPRLDRLSERVRNLLQYGFAQWRQPRYALAGLLHIVIFFGFLILSIRSTTLVVLGIDPQFTFPGLAGSTGAVYSFIKDTAAVLTLVACVAAMMRRLVFRPARYEVPERFGKGHTAEAVLILALICALLLADMFFEATQAVAEGAAGIAGPGIWVLSRLLDGQPVSVLQPVHLGSYFVHEAVFFTFLCLLPTGKHFHVITALPNVFLAKLEKAQLKPVRWGRASEDIESFGVKKVEEFTWKNILDFFTCADCGRCSDQCPANAAGMPLSPRFISVRCRDHIYDTYPIFGKRKQAVPLVGNVLSADEIWSCTTCRSCENECPLLIEYVDKIVDLRRGLIEEGNIPEGIQKALESIGEEGNSFGEAEQTRGKWSRELDFPVKNIADGPAEYLWFVGDFTSFDARGVKVARAFAGILQHCGTDFAIAYDAEGNSGNDVRRIGEEGLFEDLRDRNMEFLGEDGFQQIVTTDPHTYNALKTDYPDLKKPVRHSAEFVAEAIDSGKLMLKLNRPGCKRVGYHDPCYLGRYHDLYEAPRKILSALGCEIVEPARTRDRSFCCGAGGGGIWIGERENTLKINILRIRQFLELNVELLVVSCPKCLVMFEDALKSIPDAGGLVVKDLMELVSENMA